MPNWGEILQEIDSNIQEGHRRQARAFDDVRRKYLKSLSEHTGRNVIAYYSAFLSKSNIDGVNITDDDKNGFMMAVHGVDKSKGLDLLLHTPGGGVAATESLVHYLTSIFGNDIRAIIPQIAMSAGTMMACCCKEIVLAKHSNLGPIDPQIGGVAAALVIKEFQRAYDEIKEDNNKAQIWAPILSRYHPTFLDTCELAVEWAKEFVESRLAINMFSNLKDPHKKASQVVEKLLNAVVNKAHDKHFHIDDCKDFGLKIYELEDDKKFQDLVLTVHHCFMHTLSNTDSIKIIENHEGRAIVRKVSSQS